MMLSPSGRIAVVCVVVECFAVVSLGTMARAESPDVAFRAAFALRRAQALHPLGVQFWDDRERRVEGDHRTRPGDRLTTIGMPVMPRGDGSTSTRGGGSQLQVRKEWERAILGANIGVAGLEVADLDGDGVNELIASASEEVSAANRYCYVLAYNPSISDYEMAWVSPYFRAGIDAVRVCDINGDGSNDVVIGSGGEIRVFDGTTHDLIQSVSTVDNSGTGATSIRGLRTIDVDSDGHLEFVFCDDDELFIHDVETGTQEARLAGFGGEDLDVGRFDSGVDIIIANGASPGYVLDGDTHVVKWTFPSGLGSHVCVDDVDSDGLDELVCNDATDHISVYDIDFEMGGVFLRYTIPSMPPKVDAIAVGDVDGNGDSEIVVGDDQWGSIHTYIGYSGSPLTFAENPLHGVTGIAIGDCDNDGVVEIVWGAGDTTTGPYRLYVRAGFAPSIEEWESHDNDRGPFDAFDVGDVDFDGVPELTCGAFATQDGSDANYSVYNSLNHALEYSGQSPTGYSGYGLYCMRQANIDGDPQLEILMSSGAGYNGGIVCYDGFTHDVQWEWSAGHNVTVQTFDVIDVDDDGTLEVVAAVSKESSSASGRLSILDAADGHEEWQDNSMGDDGSDLLLLRVANVDSDANREIVVGGRNGGLWVLDAVSHEMQAFVVHVSGELWSLDTADLDGDGIAEIVVGLNSGYIKRFDPITGGLSTVDRIYEPGRSYQAVLGLELVDVIPGGSLEMVFVQNGVLTLRTLGGPTLWTSDDLGHPGPGYADLTRAYGQIVVDDIDDDGNQEIVVPSGRRGLRIYEIPNLLLGDMNCDGAVDIADIEPFSVALIDPDGYSASYPSCGLTQGDLNGDSSIDGLDIAEFLRDLMAP